MPRVITIASKAGKALQDIELRKVLQSEIKHELFNHRFKNGEIGSLGDFVMDWDSPQSQDVVLRKKCESGEELAVSALLRKETFLEHDRYPREALVKVCVKKTGLSSILQFDCRVSTKVQDGSHFNIDEAYYLKSSTSLGSSVYRGPSFSTLDPDLQDELKKYLESRGIVESLTNFLLHHLHKKEQGQYVNWLRKLEAMVAEDEKPSDLGNLGEPS